MSDTLLNALAGPARAALQRHGLLQPLIEKQVAAECAETISLEPEESQNLLDAFLQRHQLGTPEQLQQLLDEGVVQPEDLRWQAELPVRLERYCQEHYAHQAEARFLQRKNQLDRVVYSLLRCKDPYLARELYLRIREGEANFADLAAEYSQGHERTTKGIIGPVPLNQAHPQLAERLRISSPGTLLEPFSIENWWLVVRLESYQAASFDEATGQQMAREIFEEWVREEARRRIVTSARTAVDQRPLATPANAH